MAIFADESLPPDKFKVIFVKAVQKRYHGAWTLFAETKRAFLPVGMLFAFHSHFEHAKSPFMIVGDLVWFPWASARNKIESAVGFFSRVRKEIPMTDYAHGEQNQRFFEMLCKHGVMRRVGITFNVRHGEPVHIFETVWRPE